MSVARRPTKQTLIMLDWDDTLFPTTYYRNQTDKWDMKRMARLGRRVRNLLHLCRMLCGETGHVCIVTNANKDWVTTTAAQFYPEEADYIAEFEIYSARDKYEEHLPEEPLKWKPGMMKEPLRNCFSKSPGHVLREVISVGDQPNDVESMHLSASRYRKKRLKSALLTHAPSLECVESQLDLLQDELPRIYSYEGDLSTTIEFGSNKEDA